jgi:hypothetical protein
MRHARSFVFGSLVLSSAALLLTLSAGERARAASPSSSAALSAPATSASFDPQRVKITSRDSYYYQIPANAEAVVYLLHGGGGQATDWFKRTETRYLWEQGVSQGYGMIAIDSSLGLNEGWANPTESSAGLDRVEWVVNDLTSRGLLRDDMRQYAIGASGGGNFLSFLHLRCPLDAIVMVSSTGKKDGFKQIREKPAVLFVIGANDTENPVEKIRKSSDKLNQISVPSEVVVLEARPLTADMLARIDGISPANGATILQRLKSGGVIGSDGTVTLSSLKYDKKVLGEYSKYKSNISEQLEIAAAGHVFDRQHTPDILNFFDTHR